VAAERGQDPADVLMDIVRRGNADILGTSMSEADVAAFFRDPLVMVSSDWRIEIAHPRGRGDVPARAGPVREGAQGVPLETRCGR
jgi:hypothetical protein